MSSLIQADAREAASNRPVPWQEFIVGGQKSGKTRRAEQTANDWLLESTKHSAVYLATGQAWDAEMAQRIARHQEDRAQRAPRMCTVEAPFDLAQALLAHSNAHTLVVVDCLTLWLTNWTMPMQGAATNAFAAQDWSAQRAQLLKVLPQCPGPVVLVSNEIGQGVIPLGREVRTFVDTLGTLNQDVARVCSHATWMVAGLPVKLK